MRRIRSKVSKLLGSEKFKVYNITKVNIDKYDGENQNVLFLLYMGHTTYILHNRRAIEDKGKIRQNNQQKEKNIHQIGSHGFNVYFKILLFV